MPLKKKSKITAEFNMSSMTDLIFLLLIFFVITSSVVKESVLKVILPKGVRTDEIVNKITHVYITEDLQYAVEKKVVPFDQIADAITAEITKSAKPTVSVGADKRIQYDKVMEMVKMCDQLGAKVVLALEKDGSVPSSRK
jgi:biopolymer transport protein ExbD